MRVKTARQLAWLKVEAEKTERELIYEVISRLFKQYGKPPAA